MKYSIALKDLPFKPEERQVIYVENQFDERINTIIKDNYERLKWSFKRANLDFIYLPLFFNDEDNKEKILYYAPYLTSEVMEKIEMRSSYLLGFMSNPENKGKVSPSFLYAPQKEDEDWIFQGQTIDINDDNTFIQWLEDVVSEIEEETTPTRRYDEDFEELGSCTAGEPRSYTNHTPQVEFSSSESFLDKIRRSIKFKKALVEEEDVESSKSSLEEIRDEEITETLEDLQRKVENLRMKGVSLGIIIELILNDEPISKLRVTDDLRIILPDYKNLEVKLSAKYKAVYFLFLNHPEGIVLQRLEEYHSELINYYRQTSGGKDLTPKMIESIKKLEVYGNNDINIVLSKIKYAFINTFDEHLSRHYIITGKAGEPYKIPLDQELIEWEDDYE